MNINRKRADTPYSDLVIPHPYPYGFPYKPYKIQEEFIEKALQLFNEGGVGIFESPTGTGKTLSVLCSTLSWLEQNQCDILIRQLNKGFENKSPINSTQEYNEDKPKWIQQNFKRANERKVSDFLEMQKESFDARKQRAFQHRMKSSCSKIISFDSPINSFNSNKKTRLESFAKHPTFPDCTYQDKTLESDFKKVQILISSRTHSQLAQYIGEIKKTKFYKFVKIITLGSRKQYCINQNAKKESLEPQYLNESCRKLTQENKCEFRDNSNITADLAISEPLSIEELVKFGQNTNLKSCPYYGTREAAKEADIILVPYNCILDLKTMESLGLSIEGNILIFDEAHNIINAINSSNSCSLSLSYAHKCAEDISHFFDKYGTKLSPTNAFYLKQIRLFCQTVIINLESETKELSFTLASFLTNWGLESFDLHKLDQWLLKSGFCQKLRGFSESLIKKNLKAISDTFSNPISSDLSYDAIFHIHRFLTSLLACNQFDRIIIYGSNYPSSIRIEVLSLNAETRFRTIVQKAHAIMLLGGTMEPKKEFLPLLASLPSHKICNFSSSHVIPKEQVLAGIISKGPNGLNFDFRYPNRNSSTTLMELASTIYEALSKIPDGCIAFFPSFNYLETFHEFLDTHKEGKILREKILKLKKIFYEKKTTLNSELTDSLNTSNIFEDYSSYIESSNHGALLLCVMNARLSEGINFTDKLARAIFIIGLPFPNEDIKLVERMKYYDKMSLTINPISYEQNPHSHENQLMFNGNELKEILCLKTINQSIGRAIRHSRDYAAILLIDQRYCRKHIQMQLPFWIHSNLKLMEIDSNINEQLFLKVGSTNNQGASSNMAFLLEKFFNSMKTI